MDRESLIFCLVGSAGSGKTSTMVKILAENESIKNSVSVTTRAPRGHETAGVTREFVTKEEFEKLIQQDALFEHELIHNNYYGTRRSTITDAFEQGYDLIFDIDIRGAISLKQEYRERVVICLIVVPSLDKLIERIKLRSTVSEQELQTRLKTTKKEYELFAKYYNLIDYITVNEQQEDTFNEINSILLAERRSTIRNKLLCI